MAQLIVTATNDGRMDNSNASWDTCHDAATGTSVDTTDLAAQTYYNGADSYLIRRSVMTFDTSSIPAGSTIDSATITLTGYTESTTYTMTSGIYGMAAYGTLGTSDFGSVTDTLQSDTKTTAQWNNAGSNVFTLNATGEGNIGIAGTTYFSFRSVDVDVADSAPGGGENKWHAARTSSTGGSEPTLTVNYTPGQESYDGAGTLTLTPTVQKEITLASKEAALTLTPEANAFKLYTLNLGASLSLTPKATAVKSLMVEYLVVAGGGGGGAVDGGTGGGGAGGMLTDTGHIVSLQAYNITVGGGGAGSTSNNAKGVNGDDSIFDTITSTGGGGGGSQNSKDGASGGSGGGGADLGGNGGAGTASQGYAGGDEVSRGGAGGGGASEVGEDGISGAGGDGGDGIASSITGSSVYYAGGGGGTRDTGGNGSGGLGGGGDGNPLGGQDGTDGLGGGGGAGQSGGDGGDGVVIIRYLTADMTATGGDITIDGDYTIHTFTEDGTITFAEAIDSYDGAGTVTLTPSVQKSVTTTKDVAITLTSGVQKNIAIVKEATITLTPSKLVGRFLTRAFGAALTLSSEFIGGTVKKAYSASVTLGLTPTVQKSISIVKETSIGLTAFDIRNYFVDIGVALSLSATKTTLTTYKRIISATISLAANSTQSFIKVFNATVSLGASMGAILNPQYVIPKIISVTKNKVPEVITIIKDKLPKIFK